MRSLPLPARMLVLFVAMVAWLVGMNAVLGSAGLDGEAVASALQIAGTTIAGLVVLELGSARRHPALVLPALGVGVFVWSLALSTILTQLDARSLIVALGLAVISVAATGGEAWWARSGRRGVEATR